MMPGGGFGTDIDWQLPGILSLDGKPIHDPATIAQALLDKRFMVMHRRPSGALTMLWEPEWLVESWECIE